MTKPKVILAGIVALLALVVPAKSADRPLYRQSAAPVSDLFSGAWLGVEAGWGTANVSPSVAISDFGPDGFIGGGSLTYRWQIFTGNYLGLSTNIDYADLKDSQNVIGPVNASVKTNWVGSTTVQYGIAVWPTVLAYAEGGVAYGNTKVAVNFPGGSASDSQTSVGWTVGAGVDYAFAPNWTAGVKYNYTDLGSAAYCANVIAGACLGVHADHDGDHRVLGTLKYRFAR